MVEGIVLANASAADRSAYEFYPTPAAVTHSLVAALNLQGLRVWEPACGDGRMVEALKANCCKVVATDLYEYNYPYGEYGVDYLTADLRECDMIITNPPFKIAEQFILKSIEHGRPFAMLLKSQYWHSSKRRELFERHKPTHCLPLTWRPDFLFGKKSGSPTMEVVWTVWSSKPAKVTEYRPLVRFESPIL